MSEEILVNCGPAETRVAIVDNGMLQEVYIERARSRGIVGNIYKGKVIRVMPGMQAAFVDIGHERAGFIHQNELSALVEAEPNADIRSYLREGQDLLVQVSKDPISTKGARLTTELSVSARYLVYLPNSKHIGVSNRIEDEVERDRLKSLVEKLADEYRDQYQVGGFIIRTVAEGATEEELKADIPFVFRLWQDVQRAIAKAPTPSRLYEDIPLFMRSVRDMIRPSVERVRIDSEPNFQKLAKFAAYYHPEIGERIEHYNGDRPIFDMHGVEEEIQKALATRVQLKSGGYLLVEQMEAMATIDVNTGGFVGNRNLEETIFKTNLEAASAIARQLRLRNLGGIIIIDFIDMSDESHREQVLKALEKGLQKDRAKTAITGVSELGLVEMTRKRTRESLGQLMCEPCHVCQGRGTLKSAETVCYEIFREILREARAYDNQRFLVMVAQPVIDRILEEESAYVAELESFIGRPIQFQVETLYHQAQYDIVLL